jgi:disulfide bond formation protein DsbB
LLSFGGKPTERDGELRRQIVAQPPLGANRWRYFLTGTWILNFVLSQLDTAPRRVLATVCLSCLALLGFGVYLQQVVGLDPCPMCIVQRYALILVAVCAGLTGVSSRKGLHISGSLLMTVLALSGAYVAARQSWLQWFPPEVVSCGRDLYGMIETFPLQRAIPMIFKGSGDCTKVDWTFLGGSIANWSFLWFCGMALVGALLVWRRARTD